VAVTAFKLDEGMGPSEIAGKSIGPIGWMPFTYPFNFTGQPAANIPVDFDKKGLPIGMQIVGPPYKDVEVLRLSKVYQDNFPWQDMKPRL